MVFSVFRAITNQSFLDLSLQHVPRWKIMDVLSMGDCQIIKWKTLSWTMMYSHDVWKMTTTFVDFEKE